MTNKQFAQVDALVDLLGGRRNTIKVPWWPYQDMIGGGTSAVTVRISGAHSAGDTTLLTTGWGGTNPILDLGDFIQVLANVPRLHRVIAPVNHSGGTATITIEPGLWTDLADQDGMYHLRRMDTSNPHPYLVCTMRLADPNEVNGQVGVGSPKPHLGRGIVLTFVEALRNIY